MEPRDYLAVVNEPGSGNAMAPVIAALSAAGHRTRTFASDAAQPFLRRFNVVPEPLDDMLARSFFKRHADLVIVGMSFEQTVEAQVVIEAHQRGTPALAVLDHWNNYARRFSTTKDGTLDALPDRIAVMDENARAGMLEAGVPNDRIVVTGHPYLEQIVSIDLRTRKEIRAELGVTESAFMALFASEPPDNAESELESVNPDSPLSSEIWTAADWTAQALAAYACDDAVLALKAHPLDDPELIRQKADVLGRAVLTIPIVEGDSLSLCAAADVVVGLTSMLLIEATSLGVPAISVRPIGREKDRFAQLAMGSIQSTYTVEGTIAAVREAASVHGSGLRVGRPKFVGATAAVVRLIAEMVGEPPWG
jgi:hypothetical protein